MPILKFENLIMIALDFFSKAPPGEATRYIVKKHTDKLVETILQDINDFSLKPAL